LALRFKLEVVDSPVFVYFCPCL
ncbi:hypothetical protein CG405_04070, partial [Gardnerella vaginalis]